MIPPLACDADLRTALLADPARPLNGIEWVEYVRDPAAPDPAQRWRLEVTLAKPPAAIPPAYGWTVEGGVRIVGLRVLAVEAGDAAAVVRLFLDREGDFSRYLLCLADDGFDPDRSEASFGFKASCPTELDCAPPPCPAAPPLGAPALDYLAKDYQSFRRLLTELVALRNPDWQDGLAADLGTTLIELIAYAGDALSYGQDAEATEAWLETCRHRVSAARHARLIDYPMHDGRNARGFVWIEAASEGVLPQGLLLSTRADGPLAGQAAPPGPVLPPGTDPTREPALAGATFFETSIPLAVTPRHNRLRIHDWRDARCCLPCGATEAWLYALEAGAVAATAEGETVVAPSLAAGDWLLIEEERSPVTGAVADADPARRWLVRLTDAQAGEDPVLSGRIVDGSPVPRSPDDDPLPLQRVQWAAADALPCAVVLSALGADGRTVNPVSVARGNVVPVDHGRTIVLSSEAGTLGLPMEGAERWPLARLALPAEAAPLTHQPMPGQPLFDGAARLLTPRPLLAGDPRACLPAIALVTGAGEAAELWRAMPDLLESGPYDRHFVAEMDDDGAATLRFGDGEHGRRPPADGPIMARLRIGNGRAGNIGAESLAHLLPAGGDAGLPEVIAVHQPLPATDGADPETIEEVRALAPEAFRAVQYRAVTAADWVEAARRHPGVVAARAVFRWTGSWFAVQVAIHPGDPAALVRLAGGGAALTDGFAAEIAHHLEPFRIADYDLAVRAATYVPLEVAILLCVALGHKRGPVLAAARAALVGAGGVFDPERLAFGGTVPLSSIYAALAGVPGIQSATATRFKRLWSPAGDELARGRIALAAHEIAELAADPDQPEAGVLTLDAVGGL